MPIPFLPDYYREHAVQCFRLSLAARDDDSKRSFWAMGLLWLEFAKQIENLENRAPAGG